jgi:hypothetical protein
MYFINFADRITSYNALGMKGTEMLVVGVAELVSSTTSEATPSV